MQAFDPADLHQGTRERVVPRKENEKRKPAAEDRRIKQIGQQQIKSEPERNRRGQLGVTAPDPAGGEEAEGDGQDECSCADMPADRREVHSRRKGKNEKGRRRRQHQLVGNAHGEEIGAGRKDHQGGEYEEDNRSHILSV